MVDVPVPHPSVEFAHEPSADPLVLLVELFVGIRSLQADQRRRHAPRPIELATVVNRRRAWYAPYAGTDLLSMRNICSVNGRCRDNRGHRRCRASPRIPRRLRLCTAQAHRNLERLIAAGCPPTRTVDFAERGRQRSQPTCSARSWACADHLRVVASAPSSPRVVQICRLPRTAGIPGTGVEGMTSSTRPQVECRLIGQSSSVAFSASR